MIKGQKLPNDDKTVSFGEMKRVSLFVVRNGPFLATWWPFHHFFSSPLIKKSTGFYSLLPTDYRRPWPKIHSNFQIFRHGQSTDYGHPVKKSPSLHDRKSTPTSKSLGTAEAYFVCRISPNFQISLVYAFIGCP